MTVIYCKNNQLSCKLFPLCGKDIAYQLLFYIIHCILKISVSLFVSAYLNMDLFIGQIIKCYCDKYSIDISYCESITI